MKREAMIGHIQHTPVWDVIVIGGGATGLGCAVDAVTRGYKTLLLEKADFAKGTSSKSTKLVHGGVRYLAQGNISLVREALKERGLLIRNAPHLVHKLELVIPAYSWWEKMYYYSGLMAYQLLSGSLSIGPTRMLSVKDTLRKLHGIKKEELSGGISFYDGQFDDSRLAVNLAQTIADNGGTVINYMPVTGMLKDKTGMLDGVTALDEFTGTEYSIRSRVVINAAGVLADEIADLDTADNPIRLIASQGVHIVTDRSFLPGNEGLMIPKTSDGRVMFALPWHGHLIIGTTDHPVDHKHEEPAPTEEEINLILETANQYLARPITRNDIQSVFAGLRPLVAPAGDGKSSKEISRGHKVIHSRSGLVSVIGGKWTTYRKMAEDTVNLAAFLGGLDKKACVTETLHIHGHCIQHDEQDPMHIYGADADEIKGMIAQYPEWGGYIHPELPYTRAEVIWNIRHEMAQTVEDILCRRTRSILLNARASMEAAPVIAGIFGAELDKDAAWQKKQVEAYTLLAQGYIYTA